MSIQQPFEASPEFNSKCLSPIEVSGLLSNLVLETSYCTNKQLKAFKSLEAYNQMVSGFVTSVQGAEIVNKIVVVAKARYQQRMNDPLVDIWIVAESGTQICVKKKERIQHEKHTKSSSIIKHRSYPGVPVNQNMSWCAGQLNLRGIGQSNDSVRAR